MAKNIVHGIVGAAIASGISACFGIVLGRWTIGYLIATEGEPRTSFDPIPEIRKW
jgi:uncharacterized membrane protein YeaQ/YmgE (transglycosylase-associated protein family)